MGSCDWTKMASVSSSRDGAKVMCSGIQFQEREAEPWITPLRLSTGLRLHSAKFQLCISHYLSRVYRVFSAGQQWTCARLRACCPTDCRTVHSCRPSQWSRICCRRPAEPSAPTRQTNQANYYTGQCTSGCCMVTAWINYRSSATHCVFTNDHSSS